MLLLYSQNFISSNNKAGKNSELQAGKRETCVRVQYLLSPILRLGQTIAGRLPGVCEMLGRAKQIPARRNSKDGNPGGRQVGYP